MKNIIQISVPKSGTYLLKKCICLLTGSNEIHDKGAAINPAYGRYSYYYIAKPSEFAWECQHGKHWSNHLFFNEAFVPFLNNDRTAIFFIYRDPRDQLVSIALYMMRHPEAPWYIDTKDPSFSFDDFILSLMQSGELYKNHPPCNGVGDLYQRYAPWISAPYVCSIRFEDLIGKNGGGDANKQRDVVKKIVEHLEIDISEERTERVINKLFGDTVTFRKGQIGDWKNHLKEHHKKAFKEVAGQLLIDLGYERDFNW